MAYLWAAYKMGAFGEFKAGLERQEFTETIFDTVAKLLHAGGDVFALSGLRKDNHSTGVMGVVTVVPGQMQAWPHVSWFPWASARNKVECALRFLVETKEKVNLVIVAGPQNVDFFMHLCRYGVVRRIGTGRDWLPGTDIVLFETVRR